MAKSGVKGHGDPLAKRVYPLCDFLHDLRDDLRLKTGRRYCFVLGSGASVPSGILSGRDLATNWLKEMYLRHHPDAKESTVLENEVKAWATAARLKIKGFHYDQRAAFYGELYALRFKSRPQLGQDYLRHKIEGKIPSFGYSVLSQILAKTEHRVVITTNFDHLSEDALQRYARVEPHVIGDEELAKYIAMEHTRPMIAKIHGDIFRKTYNAVEDLKRLKAQWETPLRGILKNYIPIFIGYGGNDPGFMEFLANEKSDDWLPQGLIWTYRPKSGLPKNKWIEMLVRKHDGRFVPILGFDEFLLLLGDVFGIGKLDRDMEEENNRRVDEYRKSFADVIASVRDQRDFVDAEYYPELIHSVITKLAGEKMARSWWDWVVEASKETLIEKVLPIYEEAVRTLPNSPQLLADFTLFLARNRPLYAEAEAIGKRAVEEAEKTFGLEHAEVATALNSLASLLQATNRLKEAEPMLRRALEIDEKSFGPEHPKVALRLNNLAHLLQATNRLKEAEPIMRRALEIAEKSFGPEHPKVATALNNLATLLKATNRLKEAEPMLRRALEIDEKSFGPEHPEVATELNNLAQLLEATNRLKEAEPMMRRALEIDEKSFGSEHPNVATDLNNLATLLKATNRLKEAEPMLRRALEIAEKSFGPEHPEVATGLNNLATLLQDTNRLKEAEPMMRRALEIAEKSFGPEHSSTKTVRANLKSLHEAMESGDGNK